MAVKVCLDAGHYGKYNRNPTVSSYYESDMTWKLHNYLKKELKINLPIAMPIILQLLAMGVGCRKKAVSEEKKD